MRFADIFCNKVLFFVGLPTQSTKQMTSLSNKWACQLCLFLLYITVYHQNEFKMLHKVVAYKNINNYVALHSKGLYNFAVILQKPNCKMCLVHQIYIALQLRELKDSKH